MRPPLSTLDRTLRHVDPVIDVLEPQLLEFVDDAILLRFPRHSVVVVAMALACKISHISHTYRAGVGRLAYNTARSPRVGSRTVSGSAAGRGGRPCRWTWRLRDRRRG
jgi:hypothetical protein